MRAVRSTKTTEIRRNATCLLRFLMWAKAEAEDTCGDAAVAAHIESAIAEMRNRFRVSDAELASLHEPEQLRC